MWGVVGTGPCRVPSTMMFPAVSKWLKVSWKLLWFFFYPSRCVKLWRARSAYRLWVSAAVVESGKIKMLRNSYVTTRKKSPALSFFRMIHLFSSWSKCKHFSLNIVITCSYLHIFAKALATALTHGHVFYRRPGVRLQNKTWYLSHVPISPFSLSSGS